MLLGLKFNVQFYLIKLVCLINVEIISIFFLFFISCCFCFLFPYFYVPFYLLGISSVFLFLLPRYIMCSFYCQCTSNVCLFINKMLKLSAFFTMFLSRVVFYCVFLIIVSFIIS